MSVTARRYTPPPGQGDNPSSSRVSEAEFRIIGTGVCSAGGTQAHAVFGTVAGGINTVAAESALRVPGAYGVGEQSALVSRIPNLPEDDISQRLLFCLLSALSQARACLTQHRLPLHETALYLLLPPVGAARSEYIDTDHWQSSLSAAFPGWDAEHIHFVPMPDAGAACVLDMACARLRRIEDSDAACKAVIFAGVDSLLEDATCHAWAQRGALQTEQGQDGIVLGEAAACVVLASGQFTVTTAEHSASNTLDASRPGVCLAGINVTAGQEAEQTLMQAFDSALAQAGRVAADLDALVHCDYGNLDAKIEWHAVQQQHWPLCLSDEMRVAMQLGEIDAPQPESSPEPESLHLADTLGALGVAALPLGLVVACERFAFTPYPVTVCGIVESGEHAGRSVVILSCQASATPSKSGETPASIPASKRRRSAAPISERAQRASPGPDRV